jgi:hypothetical protein
MNSTQILELPKKLPEINLEENELETETQSVYGIVFPAKTKIDTNERKKLIFVSSPLKAYEKYTIEDNIEKAKGYCRDLLLKHQNCLAPHLFYTQILDDTNPYERKLGMKFALELLERCDEMYSYILDGYISSGMHKELTLAEKLKIPVNKIFLKSGE